MKETRVFQLVGYLIPGLVLGYLTLVSMMWAVWGAPIPPTHYVALLGALAVVLGAFLSLATPDSGRVVALVGLFAMGSSWIPGVVSLVPRHNVIISPLAHLAFLLYFAAVAFVLLYPKPWRWSVPALAAVLCLAFSFAAVTTVSRVRSGEFARPSFAYFRWRPGGDALTIERDSEGWMDSKARSLLQQAGIRGKLEWTGSSGERGASHRVILLAQEKPSSRFGLHYPRDDVLIYAYDGAAWRMIPENADTFPSFATIEPQNSGVMLWQDVDGARQGGVVFTW